MIVKILSKYRILIIALLVTATASFLWYIYNGVWHSGYDKCQSEYVEQSQTASNEARKKIINLEESYKNARKKINLSIEKGYDHSCPVHPSLSGVIDILPVPEKTGGGK